MVLSHLRRGGQYRVQLYSGTFFGPVPVPSVLLKICIFCLYRDTYFCIVSDTLNGTFLQVESLKYCVAWSLAFIKTSVYQNEHCPALTCCNWKCVLIGKDILKAKRVGIKRCSLRNAFVFKSKEPKQVDTSSKVARGRGWESSGGTCPETQDLDVHQHIFCNHLKCVFKQTFTAD